MKNYIFFLAFLFSFNSFSQIGVNTTTPEAMLDVSSTNNGFLIPRISLTGNNDVSTVANPNGGSLATSTMVYNTNATTGLNGLPIGYCYWNGTQWVSFAGNNSHNWGLFGNSNTTSPSTPAVYGTSTIAANESFIGTTDTKDVVFGTNNLERMRINEMEGNIGIGKTAENLNRLDVKVTTSLFARAGNFEAYSRDYFWGITGVRGAAFGNYSGGSSTGGVFSASGINNSGYGVYAISNGANTNYGGYFSANGNPTNYGGTTNYGGNFSAMYGTTNYAGYFSATYGTNNYAIVVPSNSGNVGFGTIAPNVSAKLNVESNSEYGILSQASGTGTGTGSSYGGSFTGLGYNFNNFGVQGNSSGAVYGNFGGKFTSDGGQVATGGDFFANNGSTVTTGGYFEAKGATVNYGGRFATYGPNYSTGANTNYAGNFFALGAVNNYAGYFNAVSGTNNYALVTASGLVGVGNTTPNRAKLQVEGVVGNTVATFNSSANSNGLAIVSDWPGLYFNSYFDGGTRQMSSYNYPAIINYNPNGQFEFTMSNTVNTIAGNLCLGTTGGFANRFILHRNNGAIINYNNPNITGLEVISGNFSTNLASFNANGDSSEINNGKGIEAAGNYVGVEGRANGPQSLLTGDKMGGLFYVSSNLSINNFAAVGSVIDFTNYKIIGGGIVSTLVKDEQEKARIMVAPECPEALFQDYGIGSLINGYAKIDIDPILAKNIRVDQSHPLKVFIQLEGDCNGVYVTNKSSMGFEVIELQSGNSNVSFSYQIVAFRADEKGEGYVSKYSDMRFKPFNKELKVIDDKIQTNDNNGMTILPHKEAEKESDILPEIKK